VVPAKLTPRKFMKYSIIIPTYNKCQEFLIPCIESILKYTDVYDIELIISANGCKDNTIDYLNFLKKHYDTLGLHDNLKIIWNESPLGFAKATNLGIEAATTDLITLVNNDVVFLEQPKNHWIELLARHFNDTDVGISSVLKGFSPPAGRDFGVFFCVMIHRRVFDKIGLLSLDYGIGAGEDTEFCIHAEDAGFKIAEAMENKRWSHELGMMCGDFPIYHKGEGTVHDPLLVSNWDKVFLENSITLSKKFNPKWYEEYLMNKGQK